MHHTAPHSFHIPVMGLAYTIDTPVKVARFGINSVVSIIEDNLVEKMRRYYYTQLGEPCAPITHADPDYRARRITDYLNLLNRIVHKQVEDLRNLPFTPGNDLCKYFELLPDNSSIKSVYGEMMAQTDPVVQLKQQAWLRKQLVPGSIDVNIMTKLDKNNTDANGQVIEDGSDAVAALRGFVRSDLSNASLVLSAGMNPRLFAYMEKLTEFDADENGWLNKKIVIKVSDYRSALIQGKMLAKKGLWTSEFRIESGLNCGGHAFASDGYLLGPILEEFKNKRQELVDTLFAAYSDALQAKGKRRFDTPHTMKITVQGGIGTAEEDTFLRTHYGVDGTGWGTPFLLVPEATTVDEHTLQQLTDASEEDVVLSHNSPLGVRFHYLKGTTAEQEKFARAEKGKPGSLCSEKFLVSNTEFSEDLICTASRTYQRKKLEQLQAADLAPAERESQIKKVLAKECLCTGLSNAALQEYGLGPLNKRALGVNVCPGPNIAYFSKVVSLREMIDHIYGRANVITRSDRPHMFIKELSLYIDYWKELLNDASGELDGKRRKYVQDFHQNIAAGISYYRGLADKLSGDWSAVRTRFQEELAHAESQLEAALGVLEQKLAVHA
ncbi:MAG: hypothetical protein U0V64_14595 [Cyclobacteriaceae bacterium]